MSEGQKKSNDAEKIKKLEAELAQLKQKDEKPKPWPYALKSEKEYKPGMVFVCIRECYHMNRVWEKAQKYGPNSKEEAMLVPRHFAIYGSRDAKKALVEDKKHEIKRVVNGIPVEGRKEPELMADLEDIDVML